MPLAAETWTSLEAAKLAVGVLTPLSVAGLGWYISRSLKRLELLQWTNQKLIEKRIAIYDDVGPKINQLFCFYMWVGNWKDISPPEVLQIKRELDHRMYVYEHLFDRDVYFAFREFMGTLFDTFQGVGMDAKIKSRVKGPDGDRTSHGTCTWVSEWDRKFSDPAKAASLHEVEVSHAALIKAFARSIGVKDDS